MILCKFLLVHNAHVQVFDADREFLIVELSLDGKKDIFL